MLFIASKLLSFATEPGGWVALLLLGGLVALHLGRRRLGLRLCEGSLLLLLFIGWQVPADGAIRLLENQSPPLSPRTSLQGYVGVVVLGGALERSALWEREGQVALKAAAERMTVPVGLLHQYPQLRILFTGGEGDLRLKTLSEADRAKIFFDSMGVPPERVIYEAASRTTYDNGAFSARLPGVDPRQPWLLLTSAYHMPRSLAVFRKTGWNVTPYPVDYQAAETTEWYAYSMQGGAYKWHLVLHETIGYWAYRLTGRI